MMGPHISEGTQLPVPCVILSINDLQTDMLCRHHKPKQRLEQMQPA